MLHTVIHIQAIPKHRTSGNISGAKEVLNIPNKDIVCIVWSVVHNKFMEINLKIKTIFFTVMWYNGGPTTELFRHLKKWHPELQQTTSHPAGFERWLGWYWRQHCWRLRCLILVGWGEGGGAEGWLRGVFQQVFDEHANFMTR